MKLTAAIGGLAGACTLTLINQGIAKLDRKAPRMDLLGMNAVAKLIKSPKTAPPLVKDLLPMSLTGDLVSNSLYYALASGRSKNQTLLRGLLLGLGAGMGAVALPGEGTAANLKDKDKLLTIAWYVIGGLVAAAAINAIDDYKSV